MAAAGGIQRGVFSGGIREPSEHGRQTPDTARTAKWGGRAAEGSVSAQPGAGNVRRRRGHASKSSRGSHLAISS